MKDYYNTNKERGRRLQESRFKARSQQELVLDFFRQNPAGRFSVHEIRRQVLPNAPHHSAQRAVTNLTDAGHLVKTDMLVVESYGRQVHTWRLNVSNRQIGLFDAA